jgi:CRISPR-associated protein Cmr1
MQRLQLTCEVVTPLFCAGADQQRPEIRPPSIRGAMRFWFRALHGAVMGNDVKAVQQRESAVFGATERASVVKIRVQVSSFRAETFKFTDLYLRYLGFGLFGTRDGGPRSYVPPGTKFGIELLSTDAHILDEAAAALWMLLNLGGLGARSRRGWGSLRVIGETSGNALKFVLPFGQEFKNRLQMMLQLARQTIRLDERAPTGDDRGMPSYPRVLPGYWRMKLVRANEQRQPFRTWEEALIWAGQRLRRFREDPNSALHTGTTPRGGTYRYKIGRDYREVKKVFTTAPEGELGPLRLPIFGLPVQYRFQSEHNQQATVDAARHNRRASPLWIRAYRGESGIFLGFMLFKAQFLPDGESLTVKGAGKTFTALQPDYTLLDEFFDRLPGEEIAL